MIWNIKATWLYAVALVTFIMNYQQGSTDESCTMPFFYVAVLLTYYLQPQISVCRTYFRENYMYLTHSYYKSYICLHWWIKNMEWTKITTFCELYDRQLSLFYDYWQSLQVWLTEIFLNCGFAFIHLFIYLTKVDLLIEKFRYWERKQTGVFFLLAFVFQ